MFPILFSFGRVMAMSPTPSWFAPFDPSIPIASPRDGQFFGISEQLPITRQHPGIVAPSSPCLHELDQRGLAGVVG
jgi:hypothetical protein